MNFLLPSLLSCVVISLLTSLFGVFVINKKTSLMGESISHALVPGVGLGLYLGGANFSSMFLGAFGFLLIYALIFNLFRKKFAQIEDSLFAVFQVSMLSLGAILISQLELNINIGHILFGNIFSVSLADFWKLLGLAGIVTLSFVVLKKDLVIYFFDAEFYQAYGRKEQLLKFYFDISLGIVLILALQTVGALLSLGLLVLPSLTALLLGRTFRAIFLIALAISTSCCALGLWMSFSLGWPAGPSIILCLFLIFIAASLLTWRQKL